MTRCILKTLLFVASLILIGLPIMGPFGALLAFAAAVLIWESALKQPSGKAVTALALVPLLLVLRGFLPDLRIEERSSPFVLQAPDRNPFATSLPKPVYDALATEFQRSYPLDRACATTQVGCWRSYPETTRPYGFSADSLLDHPRYSRVVDDIRFSDLQGLRMPEMNDRAYNFYEMVPGNIQRSRLPYFVGYTIPSELAGARLCWRGKVLWPSGDDYAAIDHAAFACRDLTEREVGHEVFGYRIRPDSELAMSLERPSRAITSDLIRTVVIPVIGLALLLATVLRTPPPRRFLPYLVALSATVLTALIINRWLVGGLILFRGGNDGMVHDAFGHDILRALAAGAGWQSLVAGEPVFYFMPGLRYLIALEKLVFGETHWLSLMLLSIQPIVVYRLCRLILPQDWSTVLIIFYLFLPLFEHMGFAHFLYVKQAADGNPESVAHFFLFAAMLVTLPVVAERRCGSGCALAIGLLWFGTVAIRPNFAIAAMILPLFAFVPLLWAGQWKAPFLAAAGISPVLLIPLHNWLFGHTLVAMTASALIPQNLQMTPTAYGEALAALLSFHWHAPALADAMAHVRKWNNLSDIYRLLPFATLIHLSLRRRTTLPVRALAWAGLGQQALLFFYIAGSRYSYGAWFIAFPVFAAALHDVYLPWLRARMPRLSALSPPPWLGRALLHAESWAAEAEPSIAPQTHS